MKYYIRRRKFEFRKFGIDRELNLFSFDLIKLFFNTGYVQKKLDKRHCYRTDYNSNEIKNILTFFSNLQ